MIYRIILQNRKTGQELWRDYDLDKLLQTTNTEYIIRDMKDTLEDNKF